jgi:hypothetical protein
MIPLPSPRRAERGHLRQVGVDGLHVRVQDADLRQVALPAVGHRVHLPRGASVKRGQGWRAPTRRNTPA